MRSSFVRFSVAAACDEFLVVDNLCFLKHLWIGEIGGVLFKEIYQSRCLMILLQKHVMMVGGVKL